MDFSVIIPHRHSLGTLPKLLSSIPNDPERIEIIIVDNSDMPISDADIKTDRKVKLLYSDKARGAGGARNEGIEHATGEWLVFADADDFFTPEAFALFSSYVGSEFDVVYFSMGGMYLDTGEPSDRGDGYAKLISAYKDGKVSEKKFRYSFPSPCCKMVRAQMVQEHHIRYDEVTASNDVFFATNIGYYARKIEVRENVVYIATVSRGTLTRRRDEKVIAARLYARLHTNAFLKEKGEGEYQYSVMIWLVEALKIRFSFFVSCLKEVVRFKQNPFIGYRNWFKTFRRVQKTEKKEKKYITR